MWLSGRSWVNGPDAGALPHGRVGQVGGEHAGALPDGGILDVGVGADDAARADHRPPLEDGTRQDSRVAADLDLRADQDAVGAGDVDAVIQVAEEHPLAREGVEREQLPAVVRAEDDLRVPAEPGPHPAALRGRDGRHVGQIVFPLRVLGGEPFERPGQKRRVKPVDARVDLGDRAGRLVAVALLHDGAHAAVRAAQNPPVADGSAGRALTRVTAFCSARCCRRAAVIAPPSMKGASP